MVWKHTLKGSLIALMLGTLAACQPQDESMQDDVDESSDAPDATEQPIEEAPMSEDANRELDLEAAVEAARSDLAQRIGLGADAIAVVDARDVTWPNGAMGCPEEGMMYTQALVKGYYILLDAEGDRHAYHAGRNGQPFHCPAERSQKPPSSTNDNPEV